MTSYQPVHESREFESFDELYELSEAEGLDVKTLTPRQLAWHRFRRHKAAMVCTVIFGILVIMVVFAPVFARYGVNEPVFEISERPNQFLPPQSAAWFGTDDIGRDIYSRLLFGIRTSIFIGVATGLIATVVGATIGAVSGLHGGRVDDGMMRGTDVFLAFPFIVAVIVVREFMGGLTFLEPIVGDKSSVRFIIFLLAIFAWMGVARLVRGQVLALKEREFIEASRAVGASQTRIIVSHLLPNSIGPILVALTLTIIGAIVAESTLAFFGFGPQPGTNGTSLGNLVLLSRAGATQGNWWLVVFPCGALVLLAICINFIGDGLRDAFDPKMDAAS
ncbi:MAG TPA: ABC transporter permease [Ilumatobacteraceae bacterium]|nr:ABC transporter permease [Ilumatobacteraceae bacterium]